MNLLVIDDDDALRNAIAEILSDEGFQVVCAANGQDALDHLRSGAPLPFLIILDLMMPVMNGWEFREQQKRDPQLAAIPVVVISAHGGVDRKSIDANDLIFKPVRLQQLLEVIERHA